MRVERAAALAAVLLAAPCVAQDLGQPVTFHRKPTVRFAARADDLGRGRKLYDSGPSDPVAVTRKGQVLLFHGISPDPGVAFHVGRELQNGWADWQAEIRRFPNGRFWGRARLLSGQGRVRLRAYDRGVSFDHDVEVLGAEIADESFEDPVVPAPVPVPSRPTHPEAPRPPFFPRARWSARPPTVAYSPVGQIWRLTLHHTDGAYTRTLQESLDETRFIQDFHQNGRKWIDIAYHYLIDEQGRIIEGRPEDALGAHALNNNEGNIGVCLLGKYHAPGDHRPTPAQLDAVAALARYVVLRHGVDPLVEFKGHRDFRSTDCPGDHGYARMPELRRFADGIAPATAPVPPTPVKPSVMPALTTGYSWDGQRQIDSSAAPNASL